MEERRIETTQFKSMQASYYEETGLDIFVSYNTLMYVEVNGKRYINEKNYSTTTQCQLTSYLGINKKDRDRLVKDGKIQAVSEAFMRGLLYSKYIILRPIKF